MRGGNRKGCFKDVKQRLLDRHVIDPATGCWLWTGAQLPTGYGYMAVRGRRTYPHRASYEEFIGPIPDGLLVMHKCDVPRCINPEHLQLGTAYDNVHDMHSKGRHVQLRGQDHSNSAKLTNEQILLIRTDTRANKQIAADYGISNTHVSRIKLRRRWCHL